MEKSMKFTTFAQKYAHADVRFLHRKEFLEVCPNETDAELDDVSNVIGQMDSQVGGPT